MARRLREVADRGAVEPFTAVERQEILLQLANQLDDEDYASWERAMQFYLAIRACLDDLTAPHQHKRLRKHASALFMHLDSRFHNLPTPTIYDSPDAFDSKDPEYVRLIHAIRMELKQFVESKVAGE